MAAIGFATFEPPAIAGMARSNNRGHGPLLRRRIP
jgi:hypothetical protein